MTAFEEEIRRQIEYAAGLPKPVSYIVLDPNWSPSLPHIDGEDASGRRYVVFSPAVLDEVQYRPPPFFDPFLLASRLAAIPVVRREDLPDSWPE